MLGFGGQWVALGHGRLGLVVGGLVWGLGGLVRVSFGLGWEEF